MGRSDNRSSRQSYTPKLLVVWRERQLPKIWRS